jgi:uncharacterized protein (TIGR02217 family)
MAFHEVQFPPTISVDSRGGPERKTEIVLLGSGYEERNQRWADSRRRYNAGYGVKSLDDLHTIAAFYEERRGQLHGFRWKDWSDYKSCAPLQTPANDDQNIGTGDGAETAFQLRKQYGSVYSPYYRDIKKPVTGTVLIAVNAVAQTETTHYTIDYSTGIVTFVSPPTNSHAITAGFQFDVPVRFDTDYLELQLVPHQYGNIPDIPIIELRV